MVYTVLVAGSGEEALDLLDNAAPDLVLLDVELGGIDGFTTCQRIRQCSNVPILMVASRVVPMALTSEYNRGYVVFSWANFP